MPPTPYIEPLSRRKRQVVFIATVCTFVVVVPLLVFYAIGYRFDFADTEQNIRSVGGLYVSAAADDIEIFINDEAVQDMRTFQRAAYIQNVVEGMHQVHVQGDSLHTWVKELPVFPHYVTEASSFNMPRIPQVRVITERQTDAGATVIFESLASTTLAHASTSNVFLIATSTATTSYVTNPEYEYVQSRFASSTEAAELQEAIALRKEQPFMFASELPELATTTLATTTKQGQNMRLYESNGEVYVRWTGNQDSIPYYFCVQSEDIADIAALYGEHVGQSFQMTAHASSSVETFYKGQQWCRNTIMIDRGREEVTWFDFHPSLSDIVVLRSTNGLYAVEIDDRAWQNRQMLYAGETFRALIDSSSIYIEDGLYVFELLPELISG